MRNGRIAILERAGIKAQVVEPNSTLAKAIAGLQNIFVQPESLPVAGQERVAKAEQLMRITLYSPAMDELQTVRSLAPNSPLLNLRIAQVFRARNENAAAINTLKRAYPDYGQTLPEEMTREVWDIFYPLNWWPTIQQEARRYNIDPYLVAGVIRQETIFNPQARSRANALGLMQLLPATGRLVARKYSLGNGQVTPSDLYNPILNIQLGTAYLSDMIQDFGRFEYAAAAYNGGPSRVVRWMRELPSAEIEEWVDSIPFSETRAYVQGVYRNARQYQRLYDEQGRFRSVVPKGKRRCFAACCS
jgi:soluble lytic murein transglycosylase